VKEIVILSGKGGTGKTSITASLAWFARKEAVIADCDVDAANLHLLFKPDMGTRKDFFSGYEVVIDKAKCISCGKCEDVCAFNALEINQDGCMIDALSCEGCGYCTRVCPTGALSQKPALTGEVFESNTRVDMPLVHARMEIGAENSGRMVTQLKKQGRELAKSLGKELLLVDGTPGIGCPVIASLSGADLVVLVTEPTLSGLHDLERVYLLVKRFGISATCIINKSTLNEGITQQIKRYLKEKDIILIGEIPYHEAFVKAMVSGVTLPEYDPQLKKVLEEIYHSVRQNALFPGVRMVH